MISDYYAFSELDNAINRTKNLLWPVKKGIWLRLAIISLFAGAGTGLNPFQIFSNDFGDTTTGTGIDASATGAGDMIFQSIGLVLVLCGAILLITFLLGVISSIFQFVFVDYLTGDKTSISKYFRMRIGKGVRVFLFLMGIGIAFFVAIALPLALFLIPGVGTGIAALPGLFSYLLLIFLLGIPFFLIYLFTFDFVIPIMIKDDCGVIAGWKTCLNIITNDWKQALFYAVSKFILTIATTIIIFIVVLIAAIAVAIPLIFIGVLTAAAFAAFTPFNIILVLLGLLILTLIVVILMVPFSTFYRHYSLQVLGRLDGNYNLLLKQSV